MDSLKSLMKMLTGVVGASAMLVAAGLVFVGAVIVSIRCPVYIPAFAAAAAVFLTLCWAKKDRK